MWLSSFGSMSSYWKSSRDPLGLVLITTSPCVYACINSLLMYLKKIPRTSFKPSLMNPNFSAHTYLRHSYLVWIWLLPFMALWWSDELVSVICGGNFKERVCDRLRRTPDLYVYRYNSDLLCHLFVGSLSLSVTSQHVLAVLFSAQTWATWSRSVQVYMSKQAEDWCAHMKANIWLLVGPIRLESAVGCLWVHCPDPPPPSDTTSFRGLSPHQHHSLPVLRAQTPSRASLRRECPTEVALSLILHRSRHTLRRPINRRGQRSFVVPVRRPARPRGPAPQDSSPPSQATHRRMTSRLSWPRHHQDESCALSRTKLVGHGRVPWWTYRCRLQHQ